MTPVYDLVVLALSKLGVAGGVKAPRQADLDLGLTTLRSLYRQLIAGGSLGTVRDKVIEGGDYTARPNERILRRPGAGRIVLPDLISHRHSYDDYGYWGADDHRPGPPADGSFVIINDQQSGNVSDWIYEAYTAKWNSLNDLSLQRYEEVRDANGGLIAIRQPSFAPLSTQDENGLAAMLATKLADHFGAQLQQSTVHDATVWQQALVSRFGSRRREVPGQFF